MQDKTLMPGRVLHEAMNVHIFVRYAFQLIIAKSQINLLIYYVL